MCTGKRCGQNVFEEGGLWPPSLILSLCVYNMPTVSTICRPCLFAAHSVCTFSTAIPSYAVKHHCWTVWLHLQHACTRIKLYPHPQRQRSLFKATSVGYGIVGQKGVCRWVPLIGKSPKTRVWVAVNVENFALCAALAALGSLYSNGFRLRVTCLHLVTHKHLCLGAHQRVETFPV